MTLPLAIRRAGLDWNILPEEQHYILGGRLRGEPMPTERKIYTIHYRNQDILREIGLLKPSRRILNEMVGVSYVRRLVPDGDADQTEEG